MAKGTKKNFAGMADKTGLAGQSAKGFGGLVQVTEQETFVLPGNNENDNDLGLIQPYEADATKSETFVLLITHSEMVKNYTHMQRVAGRTTFNYSDAINELLKIAQQTVGQIPERPDEIKIAERRKGRRGSPGRKVAN